MPSPFPGMNPYLEQDDVWHDFHERFIPYIAELLTPHVRPAYIVKLDEHVYIHEGEAEARQLLGRADVALARERPASANEGAAATGVLEAPAYGRLPLTVDVERHPYIEIRDRRSRELVTVIELLSPSNKAPGPDREQYLIKRRQFLASTAHFVEIDLLRGGPRMPVEDAPPCDYRVIVSRHEERPERVGVWPIQLRDALPLIPIPLRGSDPDVELHLQPALHHIYDIAGYEDYIYSGEPQPPLSAADTEWAASLAPAAE